ncbi:hypothetical protein JQ621_14570 [Bradyrhizobium manausense]|uniref:hypothetical protein n=1 Tax=Bradyrhizobium manausense TaxID=989370 RepID=UPI001BA6F338|nr:hypothetical protein [Bradyrhizobium manausense]MBR1088690.1 hypothetical protein [Bradyrhizobium manausense]
MGFRKRINELMIAFLQGIVGAALFSGAALADPLLFTSAPAPGNGPAVDGFNGKAEAFGGSLANRSLGGAQGAVTMPLGQSIGAQLDGAFGSFDGSRFGNIAGHFFWRNPGQALFGVYASHTAWDRYGGARVSQVAGEGEYYFGRFTIQGIAGVEFGNQASLTTSSTSIVAPAAHLFFVPGAPGVITATTSTSAFDVRTRFFDQINLKYYLTDDWMGYVGHRYLGGKNAMALGSEYAFPLGHQIKASAFFEARVGEGDTRGIWGGLKFYFGQKDKPLIARHRQDDPNIWSTDTLFSIVNSQTGSSSSTSSVFCNPPDTLIGGKCVSEEE